MHDNCGKETIKIECMNNQKGISALVFVFIAIIVLGIIGIIMFFPTLQKQVAENWENNQTPMPTPTPTPIATQTPAPDSFSETGNLVVYDSATGAWGFLYEKPGAPALRVKLIFTLGSRCVLEQTDKDCANATFVSGDRVQIEGRRTVGDEVLVTVLTKISSGSQMANPASVYCVEQGGNSEIVTAADGSQFGNCVFPDGRTCDEWDFLRTNVCGQ